MAINFNGVRIKPASGGAGGGVSWPGDGTKILAGDGSQVVVGDGLDLSAGTLTSNGPSSTYIATVGDSSVSLLLHMNGANNSTTFTDNSYTPKAATVSGNAKISTTDSKFGGSSGYFDGNGDQFYYSYNNDFNLSTGDFTIEGWVNPSSLASQMCPIAKHQTTISQDWQFYIINSTTIGFAASGLVTRTVPTITTGTWYHFAVVKLSGNTSIYWNGIRQGATFANVPTNSVAAVVIGADRLNAIQYPFHGYIDEIRVSKGIARYSADFTPSATAFANPDGSAELPAAPVAGDVVYSDTGIYVCSSASPVVWKKFDGAPTQTITI